MNKQEIENYVNNLEDFDCLKFNKILSAKIDTIKKSMLNASVSNNSIISDNEFIVKKYEIKASKVLDKTKVESYCAANNLDISDFMKERAATVGIKADWIDNIKANAKQHDGFLTAKYGTKVELNKENENDQAIDEIINKINTENNKNE